MPIGGVAGGDGGDGDVGVRGHGHRAHSIAFTSWTSSPLSAEDGEEALCLEALWQMSGCLAPPTHPGHLPHSRNGHIIRIHVLIPNWVMARQQPWMCLSHHRLIHKPYWKRE